MIDSNKSHANPEWTEQQRKYTFHRVLSEIDTNRVINKIERKETGSVYLAVTMNDGLIYTENWMLIVVVVALRKP